MKKRLIALSLTTILLTPTTQSADWTAVIDAGSRYSQSLEGTLSVSDEAFWFGRSSPVSPESGKRLSVHEVPDRLTLEAGGQRAHSSRRGLLWHDVTNEVGAQGELIGDARSNGWGISAGDGSLMRRAADGAQTKRWSADQLGVPGFHLLADGVAPFRRSAGAWVLVQSDDGSISRILKLDEQGRELQRLDAGPGAARLLDDGHGGVFAIDSMSIQRLHADPAQSWRVAVTGGTRDARVQVTDAGGLVIESPGSYVATWRLVSPGGRVVVQKQAHFGAPYGGGLWLWSGLDGALTHYRNDGSLVASNTITMPTAMVAHANGRLLVDIGGNHDYVLYGPNADVVYRQESNAVAPPSTQSKTLYNDGQPMRSLPGSDLAVLIDRQGLPMSAPFDTADGNLGVFWRAVADGSVLCVERKQALSMQISTATPKITCQDRTTGAPLGLNVHLQEQGELLDAGPIVRIRTQGALHIYTSGGELLNRISLDRAIDVSARNREGAVILVQEGAIQRLQRHALDGSLLFDLPVAAGAHSAKRVFLSDDGSTLLYRSGSFGQRIERYDDTGTLVGARDFSGSESIGDVIDAQSSSLGTQLLTQHGERERDAYGIELVALSADLAGVRARHSLPDTRRNHASLTAVEDGGFMYLGASDAGLVAMEIDASNGSIRSKRVLPIANPNGLGTGVRKSYHADPDETIWMQDVDVSGARDVLNRSDASPLAGIEIGQAALRGAWYSESSTGQGLVVDIDPSRQQLFAAWHTYGNDGDNTLSGQRWYTITGAVGQSVGRATLPIYQSSGGRFDAESQILPQVVGEAELVATRCDAMELWYRIGNKVGALPLHRAGASTHDCRLGGATIPAADPLSGVDASGAWYDRSRGGQGLVLATGGDRAGYLFGGWFAYDVDGAVDDPFAQHWYTLIGSKPSGYGQTVTSKLYRTIGGSISGKPSENSHAVGVAEFTLLACHSAKLTYHFDQSALAGAFAGLTREVELSRLGACRD